MFLASNAVALLSPGLYEIISPFRMNTQVDRLLRDAPTKRRKRKHLKQQALNVPDNWLEKRILLLQVCEHVERCYEDFCRGTLLPNVLPNGTEEDLKNAVAKASALLANADFSKMGFYIAQSKDSSLTEVFLNEDINVLSNVPSECTLWNNCKQNSVLLMFNNEEFVVPPNCSFILGDVRLSRHLIFRKKMTFLFSFLGGLHFDLIVLDPPWDNKSVRRKKDFAICAGIHILPVDVLERAPFSCASSYFIVLHLVLFRQYDTFEYSELFDLRLSELLADEGFVVIWMTNNEHVRSTVTSFLKCHCLRQLAVWHWLKVTKFGEKVCEFLPAHKVPFESFLIACKKSLNQLTDNFVNNFVIVSTPCSVHSRKPPILPVLENLIGFKAKSCLELFGRYLLPSTVTVGFEALKLQNKRLFANEH
uniref:Methyltransferase-like protein 4 n=1 Tax=Enterobius vermicularis TaxID=51028 RepID=A0A0N4V3U2_ENTVE